MMLIIFGGCDGNNPPSTPEITASDTLVESGAQVMLEATSLDPDQDFVYWKWEGEGTFSSTTDYTVIWTAPEVVDTQVFTLTATASDKKDASSSSSIDITVVPKKIPTEVFEVILGDSSDFRSPPFYYNLEEDFYRYQVLYLGSEIDSQGRITRISIMSPVEILQGGYHSFALYLVAVDADTVVANFEDNYGGANPMLALHSQSITYPEAKDTWFDFDLSSGFDYNPTKNLLVEFYWKGSTGVTVPSWGFATAQPRSNGSQFEDAVEGAPDNWTLYVKLGFER